MIFNVVGGSSSGGCKFIVVSSLPVSDIDITAIYLVPKEHSVVGMAYNAYAYINSVWELIGSDINDHTVSVLSTWSSSYISQQLEALAESIAESTPVVYYKYINNHNISLTDMPTVLYRQVFETLATTTIDIWFECKWLNTLSGGNQTITYYYYLDEEQITYTAQDTYGESGYHTPNHLTWLTAVPKGVHRWEVRASLSSGTATMSTGDLHGMLKGQHLNEVPQFDGDIILEESMEPIMLAASLPEFIDGEPIISRGSPMDLPLSDSISPLTPLVSIPTFSDIGGVSITTDQSHYYLIDEHGNYLIDEHNNKLIL